MSEVLFSQEDAAEIVMRAALTSSEKKSIERVASELVRVQGKDEPALYKALYKVATQVSAGEKRRIFIVRVIAALNRVSPVQYRYPERKTVKKTRALVSADIVDGQWGVLMPLLLDMCPPSALRLGLLMSYSMGFGKSAVDAYLLHGDCKLGTDDEFRVPISRTDLKHAHITYLPEDLRQPVIQCFTSLSSLQCEVDGDQKALMKKLNLELKVLMRRFEQEIVLGSKPRLRQRYLQKVPLLPLLPDAGVTVAKLFEVARTCGIAKSMPGYLRDMLAQRTLPASAVRINRTLLKSPAPVSENYGRRNKTAVDKAMELAREHESPDCIDILSECGHIPDVVWSDWRSASERCVRKILSLKRRTQKRWQEIVIETIESSPHIGVNSWCSWTLQYLATEGYDKGWKPTTFYRYLKQLLPAELSEYTAAVDVEYFDEEDLGMLIGAISAKGNAAETEKGHVSLICRMVKNAQVLQPDWAFPEITITVKDKTQQLNKRAHILDPSEMEVVVECEKNAGNQLDALVIALIGFTGMRPIEIMYLNKRDITLLPSGLEINIRRSKTPAGCRSLPVHSLAPVDVHDFLLWQFRELVDGADNDGRLFKDGDGRVARRMALIDPALERLRAHFGGGIDLYTLRHSFASWSFVRTYMAAYPDSKRLDFFPSLRHELFHAQLVSFAPLVYRQQPYHFDPDAMYRLSKLMGHATSETLPRTYVHAAGIVHSNFLTRGAEC